MQAQTSEIETTAQFRACAGESQGVGAPPGDALNELMGQLTATPETPIVIWPYNRGDAYFSDSQQQRLDELKAWRGSLSVAEQEEWKQLVEATFDATIARAEAAHIAGGESSLSLCGKPCF